jgi:hypothetical protein
MVAKEGDDHAACRDLRLRGDEFRPAGRRGAVRPVRRPAIQLEERDLVAAHPEYAEYRRRVPMLVPRLGRAEEAAPRPTDATEPV